MTDEKKLTWFQYNWGNHYIQLFIVATLFLAGILYNMDSFYSTWALILGIAIPTSMMIVIVWKGFYSSWNEYSKGE